MRLSMRGSAELLAWAAPRIPELHGQPFPDEAAGMGIETDAGELVCVVAFHSWEPWNGTIECSVVSEDARWLLARSVHARMNNKVVFKIVVFVIKNKVNAGINFFVNNCGEGRDIGTAFGDVAKIKIVIFRMLVLPGDSDFRIGI